MDEFNPEQRLMVEIMRSTGQPNPEDVVRTDPIAAALIGSHLRPAFEKMAEAATDAVTSFLLFQEQARKVRAERRRRLAGWVISLLVSLVMWWGIIAALRWAV